MHHQITFPPGKHDLDLALKVVENLFLGHGAAYYAIHRVQPQARVGGVHNLAYFRAASPEFAAGSLCRRPARAADESVRIGSHAERAHLAPDWFAPRPRAGQHQRLYRPELLQSRRADVRFEQPRHAILPRQVVPPSAEISDLNYGEVYPEGIYQLLKRLGRYGKPIYITENGLPDADDDRRPAFLDHASAPGVEGHPCKTCR